MATIRTPDNGDNNKNISPSFVSTNHPLDEVRQE